MELADRPRQVREPKEKVARLIESATTVFGTDGYARARVQDICRTAGVSVGTFYEHFESKADLLRHIAELWGDRVETPASSTREDLERAIANYIRSPIAGIARAWLEAIEVEPELRVTDARVRRAHLDGYTDWVRDARARRGGGPPLEDRATARAIIALFKEALTATDEPETPRTADLARVTWFLLFGE